MGRCKKCHNEKQKSKPTSTQKTPLVDSQGRECEKCGTYKPWDQYAKAVTPSGYNNECIECCPPVDKSEPLKINQPAECPKCGVVKQGMKFPDGTMRQPNKVADQPCDQCAEKENKSEPKHMPKTESRSFAEIKKDIINHARDVLPSQTPMGFVISGEDLVKIHLLASKENRTMENMVDTIIKRATGVIPDQNKDAFKELFKIRQLLLEHYPSVVGETMSTSEMVTNVLEAYDEAIEKFTNIKSK